MSVYVTNPALEGDRPQPIRGGLILIAILLVSILVQLGLGLLYAIDALDAAGWSAAVVRDGIDDGSVFAIRVVGITALFVWCLGVTVLFFRRSRRFLPAMTALLLCGFVLIVGQGVLHHAMTDALLLVQVFGMAGVVLYLRRSKRVKATFVR